MTFKKGHSKEKRDNTTESMPANNSLTKPRPPRYHFRQLFSTDHATFDEVTITLLSKGSTSSAR